MTLTDADLDRAALHFWSWEAYRAFPVSMDKQTLINLCVSAVKHGYALAMKEGGTMADTQPRDTGGHVELELHAQFVADMERDGYDVNYEYVGRNFYRGPAVQVHHSDLQDVIRATSVRLTWDQLGRDGLVVYPR